MFSLTKIIRTFAMVSLLPLCIFGLQFLSCQAARVADSDLEKNKQLWQEGRVDTYSFTCERVTGGTFSFKPELIEVREGKVISRRTIDGSPQYNSYDCCSDIETVEKIFDVITSAEDQGKKVQVKYNEKFGYPEEARIDLLGPPDRPFTVKVTNFKVSKAD